ncbi:hypothetical protein JXI42_06085 [bacterium]|nr:hypothetical protein [bacterium]
MKKLLVAAVAICLFLGVAYADDPDHAYEYDGVATAQVYVYAWMAGVQFSLNTTAVGFDGDGDGLTPNELDKNQEGETAWESDVTETGQLISLQNDGGINIDVKAYVSDHDVYTGTTPWVLVSAEYTAPGADEYNLFAYLHAYDATFSTSTIAATADYDMDGAAWRNLPGTQNIVAFDPDDHYSDNRELNFAILAPASTTEQGARTMADVDPDINTHNFEVALDAGATGF